MKNRITESDSQPFFSVVITTYNRAHLIKRAIKSLILQTEKNWEAIIVDDESDDDTELQVLPFTRIYRKISFISQAHAGEASAKNTGLQAAKGRFVTFLDSDDEFDKHHLKSRKSVLIKNPDLKFLFGGVEIIGNQFVPDRFNPDRMINLGDCVIGGTFFIDRILFLSLNGFRNIKLGTDADLFDRVRETGVPMQEINIPTYIYHHENEDSITNRMMVYGDMKEVKRFELK
jgi:glycosyltransferase involved in cell wall biosynthesis